MLPVSPPARQHVLFADVGWQHSRGVRAQARASWTLPARKLRQLAGISSISVIIAVGRRQSRRHCRNHAVKLDDQHGQTVRKWVDAFVIGHSFCPWAKPADDDGRIRVVTSTATTEAELVADLEDEAQRLPVSLEVPVGQATTTLLVCPFIADWEEFDAFHVYYANTLGNGDGLAHLGLKVLAFHPDCQASGRGIQEGDQVAISFGEADLTCGVVIEPEAGRDQDGVDFVLVRLQGTLLESGEDQVSMEPFPKGETTERVRYTSIVWLLSSFGSDGEPNLDDPTDCRSLIARAPYPTLHMLRSCDLAQIREEQRNEVYQKNEQRLRELGLDDLAKLLQSCE